MSSPPLQNVDEIIRRLKSAYGLKKDAALAKFLDLNASTIAAWRTRGHVPIGSIIAKCNGLSIDWLTNGTGSPFQNQPELAESFVSNENGTWRVQDLVTARMEMWDAWKKLFMQPERGPLVEMLIFLGYSRGLAEEEVESVEREALARKALDLFLVRLGLPLAPPAS